MVEGSSLYFPYWYGEKGDRFLSSNNLNEIYQSHIKKIKEQIEKRQEKITGTAAGLEEMKNIYSDISKPKNLQEAIEGNEGWNNLSETEKSLWNLSQVSRENLMTEAYSKAQTIADVANAYCEGVQDMIDSLLADPLQKTIQAALAEKAKIDSSIKSKAASKSRNKEIDRVVDEWVKTHGGELISAESLKKQYCSLSDYIVRMDSRLEELREKIALLGNVSSVSDEKAGDIKKLIKSANSLKACIQGRAGEIASALGLKMALDITAKYIIDATGQGYDGGGVKIKNDSELEQASKESSFRKRVSKPDCVITFTEDGVSVSYGVTIKNVNIKKNASGSAAGEKTVTGQIKLVENSTLLTLILQDIGYTGDSLVGIYEILASHVKDKGGFTEHFGKKHKSDSSLNKQFNSLRQILRAEAVYSSLTGFAKGDSGRLGSFFMIVNGKFFPVENVFEKIAQRYEESGGKDTGTTFTIHDGFWSRKKFTEQNVFIGDNGDRDYTVEADTRSDSAKKKIEGTLSAAKYSFVIDKQIIWDIMSSI